MNTRTEKKVILAAALGLSLATFGARAKTIYELGSVDPGSPASTADETAYLQVLITGYNDGLTGLLSDAFTGDPGHDYTLSPGSFVPSPLLPSDNIVNNGQVNAGNGPNTGLEVDLATGGYAYAVVKWGDIDEFYYINGLTGDVTFNNEVNKNGESHYDLFNATGGPTKTGLGAPDVSTTAGLLALGLTGISLFRRKFSR
jgi:hypothetical protein